MRSLSTTIGRLCAVGGLGIVVAGAAWALPADEPTIESAGAGVIERVVDVPDVELPKVDAAAAEQAATTTAPISPTDARRDRTTPSTSTTTTMPDHLVVDEHEAQATTTTTTTTVAPAPAPTTTKAPVATVAFSASQQYGSCGEAVPYDIFSGTATPGTTVTISSAYGSGTAVADAHGNWSRKVEFPSAPRNETFSVTVSGAGGSKTLDFTATGDAHA